MLSRLWQELENAQLQNQVTFGMMNVFGRTLDRNNTGGRNHNRLHAVMTTFGQKIKAGVYGAIGDNRDCLPIEPSTGAGDSGGAILADETMSACGKTLMTALGLGVTDIETRIQGGQVITGMLNSG